VDDNLLAQRRLFFPHPGQVRPGDQLEGVRRILGSELLPDRPDRLVDKRELRRSEANA
jgi:hypothetical protein